MARRSHQGGCLAAAEAGSQGRPRWRDHAAPERSVYALAEVTVILTRTPTTPPAGPWWPICVFWSGRHGKSPAELRANPALRKVNFFKNVRLLIWPLSEEEYQEILRTGGIVAAPACRCPSFLHLETSSRACF